MKFLSLVLTLVLSLNASASILTSEAGDKKVENVSIAKAAKVSLEGQDINLGVVGAGLRTKKVVVVNVKVYVAELFASDVSKFVRTEAEALKSLELSRTVAIRLNFLRTVEAEKVQVSFRDALSANGVDLNDPSIKAALEAVSKGGEAKEGGALTIVTQKNADGSESVYYEDTVGKLSSMKATAGTSAKLMAIWLGKASDGGIEKLKADLIKGL